jgi:hypothetical protein
MSAPRWRLQVYTETGRSVNEDNGGRTIKALFSLLKKVQIRRVEIKPIKIQLTKS